MLFALNQMSTPTLPLESFFALARDLGCCGVELRNDLADHGRPVFDGEQPEAIKQMAADFDLPIVGLSQIYPFNNWNDGVADQVKTLIDLAVRSGAETISLIPRNDGQGVGEAERLSALKLALHEIKPMLDAANMTALVEPLGFEISSLRFKKEVVDAITRLEATHRFKLVHDTFHHYLAGGGELFPQHTGIVHISGVVDPTLAAAQMCDEHRVLVDANDRLGNVEQIQALINSGYAGVISLEAFSPEIHAMKNPKQAIAKSFDYIRAALARNAA